MKIKKRNLTSGLSLMEVLIVVVILALLIALAATSYIKQIAKGNDSRRKADLNRIKIAIEEYEKDHNCYPSMASMSKCGFYEDIAIYPYLKNVPCDPQTKQPYVYESSGTSCPKWYRVYTVLQNKDDPQIFVNIGPGGSYNFYISSESAPDVFHSPTYPGGSVDPGTFHYGCIEGICREIPLDSQGNPICTGKTFDTSNCNGNDCTDPSNACY